MRVKPHKLSEKEGKPDILIVAVAALTSFSRVGFEAKIVKMRRWEFPVSSGSHFHELQLS
jgi:hypothetical protein